ncbi:anticodon binding domain-containing protein [Hirsutella rhossiliensis]|uniref:glycine--tRNA ligase n=1 Tax=Hirsutella rhossiliensis TaxID=111463 RepID=A0A9P8SH89_9HYPO|nr:anticodon binding domain-containing protein [Hirsutella rhossiliensis]KAH0962853.1 anticodon binding domain-containing protein [Hirsutella rhossiliensis]
MANAKDLAGQAFSRPRLESLLKRRFFFAESFEIYRTSAIHIADNRGLYDYGPPGCALQANIVNEWRNHFVIEENMMELDCTAITPEPVLKTSGHVDKFADWMCKDPVKGDYLRADHLVESVLESRLAKHQMTVEDGKPKAGGLDYATAKEYEGILAKIDNYDGAGLGQLIKQHDIRNPDGNGEVLPPIAFNLMFKSTIGPSASAPVYLRLETAQGQFLNFKKLLEFSQGSMPFASATIGKSYRNEISPRSGLLRVREFLMAEIEHFVDPETSKSHERFPEVSHIVLPFLDSETQLSGKSAIKTMSIGDAVQTKLVDNETLGYFLARVHFFLLKIGVDGSKIRFRQHLANEMAHYACDCWDAELLTSYGWIECVGCADRSAYDLSVHSKATGTALVVREPRAEPLKVEEWQAVLDKKLLGPQFKKDAKRIEAAVASLGQQALDRLAAEMAEKAVISVSTEELASGSSTVELSRDVCTIKRVTRVEKLRQYTPNVIEPSFGIGRIVYSLLEHIYWHRPQDDDRGVLSLPVSVAPTKVLIVPLSNHASLQPIVKKLASRLRKLRISNYVDGSSTSIGKRYARNDELGTPLGITVDFDTVKDRSITLRERDSTCQVRSSEENIVQAIRNLVEGEETWEQVRKRLPAFTRVGQEN